MSIREHTTSPYRITFFLRSCAFAAAVFLGGAPLFAAAGPGQSPSVEEAAVQPRVELDRPVVLVGDASPLFVLVRFRAVEQEDQAEAARPPVNLALVLDRSGSMADTGKIEYLKKAAGLAIDRLAARDHLAVVEYDDQISVLWPSAPVESTFPIKRLIEGLTPRGSTDLVGGMMRGVEEVATRKRELSTGDAIHRVLLLSDGLANHGVTDPAEIRRLVRAAKSDGVRITTLGLGRDYDEDLMQMIAENGGGNYYYIENPAQMARIFERELNTLFTTVAKDVRFAFTAEDGVTKVEVVSFGAADEPRAAAFDMEDFYAGEERAVLLRLEPDPDLFAQAAGAVTLGRVSFDYTDVQTGQTVAFTSEIKVDVTTDEQDVMQAINHEVVVEAELFETERQQAEAVAKYEQGDVAAADQLMAQLQKRVEARNAVLQDPRLASKAEALAIERQQMASATAPSARSAYLKSTKQRLYNAQKGKRALYLLQVGDKGFEVEELQRALTAAGYYTGPVDGVFSDEVKSAVEALQKAESLAVDGVAGPATLQALKLY